MFCKNGSHNKREMGGKNIVWVAWSTLLEYADVQILKQNYFKKLSFNLFGSAFRNDVTSL